VADPLKEPKERLQDVVAEAERGRSPRTPFIALTGVTLIIGAVAALLILVLFLIYFFV
jgi:hypothetical protein